MKKSRGIIAYVAKKLMDNDIFLVIAKEYNSVVVITIMFLCFDVLSLLTKTTMTMTFKL